MKFGIDRLLTEPERLDVSTLAFGVERIEDERGLARARDARHDDQLVERQVEIEVLQIVLACAAYADDVSRSVGHSLILRRFNSGSTAREWRTVPFILPESACRGR